MVGPDIPSLNLLAQVISVALKVCEFACWESSLWWAGNLRSTKRFNIAIAAVVFIWREDSEANKKE